MITTKDIIIDLSKTVIEINNFDLSRKRAFLRILETYRDKMEERDLMFLNLTINNVTNHIRTIKSHTKLAEQTLKLKQGD